MVPSNEQCRKVEKYKIELDKRISQIKTPDAIYKKLSQYIGNAALDSAEILLLNVKKKSAIHSYDLANIKKIKMDLFNAKKYIEKTFEIEPKKTNLLIKYASIL